MLAISEKKKSENIAEYILYMWQMEDLLRGLDFNIHHVESQVLAGLNEEQQKENLAWFKMLAREMDDESVRVSGHHHSSVEVMGKLVFLQNKLLSIGSNEAFTKAYKEAKPVLQEFRSKSEQIPMNEIETAFTALYGMLTLRISGKEISQETLAGIQKISTYLGQLSKAYHAEEN
jgi:hypothetical protein